MRSYQNSDRDQLYDDLYFELCVLSRNSGRFRYLLRCREPVRKPLRKHEMRPARRMRPGDGAIREAGKGQLKSVL